METKFKGDGEVAARRSKRIKLGVDIPPALKRRLEHEKTDAGLKLHELVAHRLELSYQINPGPFQVAESA